jgi:hypothetical protein
MIAIAALAAASGCRKDDRPPNDDKHAGSVQQPPDHPPEPSASAVQPRSQSTPASLTDCLKVDRPTDKEISDPHGQGSDLLGLGFEVTKGIFVRVDQFDITTFKNAAGSAIAGIRVVSHHLEGHNAQTSSPLADADWANSVVTGQLHCPNPKFPHQTYPVVLHVVGVNTKFPRMSPQGQGIWKAYQVQLELEGGKTLDACHDAGDVAFPVAGYWDDDSNRNTQNTSLFSFACTKRDVAFCITTGYRDDGADDEAQLFDACTRMMRADYCGTGKSYTRDGTFVSVWDNQNIAVENHVPPLVFEAEWDGKGVVCWARPRWTQSDSGIETPPPCFKDRPQCARPPGTGNPPMVLNDSCVTHPCTVKWTEDTHAPNPGRLHSESEASYDRTLQLALPPGAFLIGPTFHPPRPRPSSIDPVPPRAPRP